MLEHRADGTQALRPSATRSRASRCSTTRSTYWRALDRRSCTYRGRWREMVQPLGAGAEAAHLRADRRDRRRAHDEPAGDASAAPRNWDYRYTWIRDAAFTLYALLRLGFTDEADAFMHWLDERGCERAGRTAPLQIMYGIDGRHDLTEIDARPPRRATAARGPVRIGNGAVRPAPARHLRRADGRGLPLQQVRRRRSRYDLWTHAAHGSSTGSARTGASPTRASGRCAAAGSDFVYSQADVLGGVRPRAAACRQARPARPTARSGCRPATTIYETIMTHGWTEERQAFVQYVDGRRARRVDAAHAAGAASSRRATRACSPRSTRSREELVSRQPRVPLRHRGRGRRRPDGREGTFSHVHLLVRRGLTRAGPAGRGAPHLREDARLRQPPRALRRGDRRRAARRSATSRRRSPTWPDQRRLQPRPRARRARRRART